MRDRDRKEVQEMLSVVASAVAQNRYDIRVRAARTRLVNVELDELRTASKDSLSDLRADVRKIVKQGICEHAWAVMVQAGDTRPHLLCADCEQVRCVPKGLEQHLENPKLTQQDLRNLAAGLPPAASTD